MNSWHSDWMSVCEEGLCFPDLIHYKTLIMILRFPSEDVNCKWNTHWQISSSSLVLEWELLNSCYGLTTNWSAPIVFFINFTVPKTTGERGRSQWPLGLRHELPSLPRTLVSWVRNPLKAWISVCVYSVLCVGSVLSTGWSPDQGALLTVYRIKKLKSIQGLQWL
jgi:hypothetical protein